MATLDELAPEAQEGMRVSDALIPLNVHGFEGTLVAILACIWLELRKQRTGAGFGANYTRIFPVTLDGTNAAVVLEKDPAGFTRHVSIGVDSAVGGTFPSIRIGIGSVSNSGGGVLLNAGEIHDFGELGGDIALQGISTAPITLYVISRA